jgi:predicted Zn-dependent peptidase
MYQEQVLENGLRILMVPVNSFQSVSMGIFVATGSRYEQVTDSGMSHLIEHMLFKGTSKRPTAKHIAEEIEGVGGVSNAYTGQETTAYYAKVAASHVNIAIDLLTDMVRNPLFKPEELEKERLIIGEEINMIYDIPDSWVNILLDQVMWPGHPLGRNVAGTHESLAAISRDALISFFENCYHPQNVLVTLGGAFQPDLIVAEIAARLGNWSAAPRPSFEKAPPTQAEPRCRIEDRPIEQGHFCLALPGLPRNHPDRYTLSVLNTILGDGMSSRLFLRIREDKGLAYAVDSGLNFLQDTGTLVIYAGVDPGRASEALSAILAELERLRDNTVPVGELRKAKEYLKGRLVLGLEDSFSRAAWVAYQALFMETIRSPEDVLDAFEAVTAADVQSLAHKIIDPSAYTLSAVGPFGQGEALSKLIIR